MKKIVLFFIKLYKNAITPYLGNNCRYYPTCSDYAYQAVEKYGIFKGGIKAVLRILRCNQFFKGGYDPVE